jgi:hypothetical protein
MSINIPESLKNAFSTAARVGGSALKVGQSVAVAGAKVGFIGLKNSWRVIPAAAACGIFVADYEVAKHIFADESINTLVKVAVPTGITAFGAFYTAAAIWPAPAKAIKALTSKGKLNSDLRL